MAEQFSLVVLVVALATGLVTSTVAISYMQARQPEFFRYFLSNILLFNLLILAGLVLRYLQLPLQAPEMEPYGVVLPGLLVLMAAIKLGWLYAFTLMNRTLPADLLPKSLPSLLFKAFVTIFLCFMGVMLAAWVMSLNGMAQAGLIFMELFIIGGALVAAIQLITTTAKLSKDKRRRSILIFGTYHLGLMGIILAVLVFGWFQDGPQRPTQLLASGGFLILFNVFPLIWMRSFQPLPAVSNVEKFELLGITKREREIIGLIQYGKTNQEIADSLYISLATVKDHNHNIFKKCGTRNRLELAKLFQ